MATKIYRAIYRMGSGDSFFDRSNLKFHRWVIESDMQTSRDEITAILDDGTPPTIIGWEEKSLEDDEEEE